MSYVLTILIDDIVRMLEITRCWLSHMARIVKLLLLLLKLKSLLLLLLTVLRCIAVLFAFSFTLPFLSAVRCALWSSRMIEKERKKKKKLEIDGKSFQNKNFTHKNANTSTYYLAMKPLDLKRLSNFQKIRKIFIFYIDLDYERRKEAEKEKKLKMK